MPITPLPIANGSYVSNSLPISAQRCVNWYPHIPDAPSLSPECLIGTPGAYQVATAGSTILYACRGAWVMNGKPYFVLGDGLYRLTSGHVLDSLGTISGAGRVSMADNGTQLMILVPGGSGYIFTESPDTLVTISDADFTANGNPLYAVFIDGYFCCTTDSGQKFIVSALNDGTSWNALDFGSAESNPDVGVVPFVFRNQLFIAGERTIEGFQNVGGADFPFQRSGLFFDKGVKSPFSAIKTPESFMWIGGGVNEEPAVWTLDGNSARKVSTQAIDEVLQRLSEAQLEAIYGWSYGQQGHYFTGFVLPETVIVYDHSTGRWHDRESRVQQGSNWVTLPQRAAAYVSAYGKTYVGDSQDGRIGVLDPDTYDEYGLDIVRPVTFQPFQNNMQAFTVPMLEATVESGVGNDDVADPVIRLQVSRDGGKTFTDERPRKMGKIGEYNKRAVWRRNGRFDRFAVFKLTLSDAVKPVLIQMTADVQA